jgi:hypothetical protein
MYDPGQPFTPTPVDISISTSATDVHHLLFQARNGRYRLMLWTDAEVWDYTTKTTTWPSKEPVTIHFPTTTSQVTLYSTDRLCNIGFTPTRSPSRSDGGNLPLATDPDPTPTGAPVCWNYDTSVLQVTNNAATVSVDATIEIVEF